MHAFWKRKVFKNHFFCIFVIALYLGFIWDYLIFFFLNCKKKKKWKFGISWILHKICHGCWPMFQVLIQILQVFFLFSSNALNTLAIPSKALKMWTYQPAMLTSHVIQWNFTSMLYWLSLLSVSLSRLLVVYNKNSLYFLYQVLLLLIGYFQLKHSYFAIPLITNKFFSNSPGVTKYSVSKYSF